MSLEGTLQVNEFKQIIIIMTAMRMVIILQSVEHVFWTATLLRTKRIANNNKINNLDSRITSSPVCFNRLASLIPLIMY
jgi:hypothetical protein